MNNESPKFKWKSFVATMLIIGGLLSIGSFLAIQNYLRVRLEFEKSTLSMRIASLENIILEGTAPEGAKSTLEDMRRARERLPELIEAERLSYLVVAVVGSLGFGIIIYLGVLGLRKAAFHVSSKASKAESLSAEADRLQAELPLDFFTNLVKLNFKYLDAYYLQTQVQADKSFFLAVAAAVVSFIVIVFGIVLMLFEKTNPGNVTIATGAVGEVMAAVFFYLYNRTVLKMGEYHQKLVLTQNIGLSLEIAESLEGDERVQAHRELIQSLVKDINQYLAASPPG